MGYNVDPIWAVAQAAGLSIEVRLGPWAEMMRALGDGKVDAMQGMFYSPACDQRFDFSQAHIVNHSVAVVRTGERSPPASLQELEGKQIIVQDGDIMHDLVVQHGVDGYLTTVDSQEDALRALLAGECDVALVSRVTALYLIDQHGWKTLSVGKTPLLSPEYCFTVPHGSRALLAELSEGLRAVQLSGEFRRVQEKWFGVYEPAVGTPDAICVISIVVGPLVAIALLALLWVRTLRRRAARHRAAARVRGTLILILSPFTPFVCEELWQRTGHTDTVLDQPWPGYQEAALEEDVIEIPVQINGKLRARIAISVAVSADPTALQQAALAHERVVEALAGQQLVKAIPIPGKMVSLVVK